MTDDRTNGPSPIGALIEEALRELRVLSPAEAEQHDAFLRRAREGTRRNELLERGVPEKVVDALLERRMSDTQAMRETRAFLKAAPREKRILMLTGEGGEGKTFAAAWAVACDAHALMVHAIELANLDPRHNEMHAAKLRRYQRCSLLVIDDAGTEPVDRSNAQLSQLYGLYNFRYENQRRTIVTANLSRESLGTRYSARFLRRADEVGMWPRLAKVGGR
jgi:flagellar biosynthesis GTPase FlhF